MLKRHSLLTLCAALIAFSLIAVPAFAQTVRSRPNVVAGNSADTEATPPNNINSHQPNWDPAVVLDATTDWIGNTWGGNNPSFPNNTMLHVPLDMNSIYVTPDGRVFTNTPWEEGGRALSVFDKNGRMISLLNDTGDSQNWEEGVGNAVASDGKYIFASYGNGSAGLGIYYASNQLNTNLSLTGSDTVYNAQIFGLAVAKGMLYVAENETCGPPSCNPPGPINVPINLVEVFDIKSLALVNSFTVPNPVRIAVDRNGGFWVSQMGPSVPFDYFAQQGLAAVDHYNSAGNYVNTITLPDGGEVGALAFDNYLGALLVGDNGPDENVKIYANLENNPTLVGTFGEKGGVYAGPIPGRVGPLRFRGITGLGTDAEGNIYVSQSGWGLDFGNGEGLALQSYTWWGDLNWERDALEYCSLGNIDPHSETDLYSAHHHFKIDYSKSGRVDTYYADTYNGYLYPQDVRLTNVMNMGEIKYIHGRKFLVVRSQNETRLEIYRFEGGSEVGIPSVAFDYGLWQDNPQNAEFIVQPADGDEFIWRNVNGDGKMTNAAGVLDPNEFFEPNPPDGHRNADSFYLDDNGDMWQQNYGDNDPNIYWRRYYFQGFDEHGSPIYDFQHMAIYTVGPGLDFPDLTEVDMVVFDPHASKGGTLFAFGSGETQIVRYDHWDLGNRKATWSKNLITNGDIQDYWHPDNFDVAGDFIFVGFDGSTGSYNGTWSNHYIQVYSAKTGAYVGRLVAGMNVGGMFNLGNIDESHALAAYKRSNGEYVLIREEDFQAKLVMFRWTPPDPLPVPKAPAPAGVTGAPNDEAFTLTWTPDPKALSYTISSGPTSTGPFVPQNTGIFGTNTFSVVGIQPNGISAGYAKLTVFYPNGASADSQPFAISSVAEGTTYEAEDAVQNGTCGPFSSPYDSNYLRMGCMGPGATVTFNNVVVPTTGTYALRTYYGNGDSNPSDLFHLGVIVNGGSLVDSPNMPYTGDWGIPGYVTLNVQLNAGPGGNTIIVGNAVDDTAGGPDFDRIVVPFAPIPSS